MQILFNFSTKWNNKLECDYFTTLRVSGNHFVGDKGLITLKHQPLFVGEIVRKIEINLRTYNHNLQSWDYIGYLDTGYSWEETLKIIEKMNHGNMPDKIYLYLIHKTKETVQETQLF